MFKCSAWTHLLGGFNLDDSRHFNHKVVQERSYDSHNNMRATFNLYYPLSSFYIIDDLRLSVLPAMANFFNAAVIILRYRCTNFLDNLGYYRDSQYSHSCIMIQIANAILKKLQNL